MAAEAQDGPGWAAKGFGTAPTWFDLPAAVRDPARSRVYTNGPPNGQQDFTDGRFNRPHGHWRSDSNTNLANGMNKDWPGRPRFLEAYMASYFATRQWVQAVQLGVADAAFWNSVRGYAPPSASARTHLRHDLRKGARGVSYWTGHWQGQGEPFGASQPGPGGSLDDVFFSTREFFAFPIFSEPTLYRGRFENVVRLLRANPASIPTYGVTVHPCHAAVDALRPGSHPADEGPRRRRHRTRRRRLLCRVTDRGAAVPVGVHPRVRLVLVQPPQLSLHLRQGRHVRRQPSPVPDAAPS